MALVGLTREPSAARGLALPGFVVSASAANRGLTQQRTVAPQLQVGASPAVPVIRLSRRRAANVVIIGVDAHKTQHTASAVEAGTQQVLGTVEIEAGLPGDRRLLRWAQRYQSRRRAVENAHGLGRHLAPWLVARSEAVCDVLDRHGSRSGAVTWRPAQERRHRRGCCGLCRCPGR